MELRLKKYRRMLRDHGENLTDNGEDDDDDDDETEADNEKNVETGRKNSRASVSPSLSQPSSVLSIDPLSASSTQATLENGDNTSQHMVDLVTTANSANFINSFSNTFTDHLILQPAQNTNDLQNYFK